MAAGRPPPAAGAACGHAPAGRAAGRSQRVASRGGSPLSRLLAAYRRHGADLPFGDPAADHGAPMEGYYWRIVSPDAVIVVLCGVCSGPEGRWALVALAAEPGGLVRYEAAAPAAGWEDGFGVRAGALLEGSTARLQLRLDEDNRLDLELSPQRMWPRRAFGALGAAHGLPGLSQYWQPVLLDGSVTGEARVGGRQLRLDGARVYTEKNWGSGFAGRWWWGQASMFPEGDLGVAFAGGRLPRLGASPTAVALWWDGQVLRLAPPLARARVALGEGSWRIRMSSLHYRVEIEGDAAGSRPHILPAPELGPPRAELRAEQLLTGRLSLQVRHRGRLLIDSLSPSAGLEVGHPPGSRGGPRPLPRSP